MDRSYFSFGERQPLYSCLTRNFNPQTPDETDLIANASDLLAGPPKAESLISALGTIAILSIVSAESDIPPEGERFISLLKAVDHFSTKSLTLRDQIIQK